MEQRYRTPLYVVIAFALLGALFAGISTYDYAAHLDRQVHAVTCAFVPGLSAADTTGSSGCFATMMSPYSALFRASTWGGLPIALLAFAVFLFLVFKGSDTLLRKREADRNETLFLVAASALPLLTTIIYFIVALTLVGSLCRVCVGIYVASIGLFAAAVAAHRAAKRAPAADAPPRLPWPSYVLYFAEGVLFVALAVGLYLGFKPDYTAQMADCGKLVRADDRYHTRLKMHEANGGVPAIELLDPLCPACKGLHERLQASGLSERLDLEAALFPLDTECNWMLTKSLHPGACLMSEALLCAEGRAGDVLAWSFDNQTELRGAAEQGHDLLRQMILVKFPELKSCMGQSAVKAKLNKALRWAVANSLPVLTPQLYVRGKKVCDEDTDLGLEYTLTRLLDDEGMAGPAEVAKSPADQGGSR